MHGTNKTTSFTWNLIRDSVATVEGDVRDLAAVEALVPHHDAILHLAAETGTGQSMYDIVRYSEVNVMGTANLLEAIVRNRGRVAKVLVASSRSIYGEGQYDCAVHGRVFPQSRRQDRLSRGDFEPDCPVCGGPVAAAATSEDAQLSPASVYAATKLAQENLVLTCANAQGIPAYALRYQNVYGTGQSLGNPYTGIMSIFSREMLAGRPIEIFEDGHESRDFVHVDDVAAANVLALTADRDEQLALNIGSGVKVSVADLTRLLARIYGFQGEISVSGRYRAGDIRHNFADTRLAQAQLGFAATIDIATGIARFAEWVQAQQLDDTRTSYVQSLAELQQRGLIGSSS